MIDKKGYSFDDVLLIPQYSEVISRSHVNTKSSINGRKKSIFKYPIISANMDTITGVEMANAMYSAGALGILNRHQFKGNRQEHLEAIEKLQIKSFS